MKKYFRIAAFVILTAITTITLTSGISDGYRSGGGDKNLVDELYDQAVKQNDNLESIEEDIDKFYKKRSEALEKYNSFTYYNNRYYTDARAKAATISDAASRQKANDIINISETKYKVTLTDWQTNIAGLNAAEKELNDLHTLLKVMTTEPMIVKYQSTGLPDNAKLKEANGDLLKVIGKIKAITR